MDSKAQDHEHHGREITVNGQPIRLSDRQPTGAQVLAEAGFEPVDEHVPIQRMKIGSQLVSLDEVVNLRGEGLERFYAFRTGEVFTFTVNTHGFQWGRPAITEPELREFVDVDDDDVLVQQRGDDEPRVLGADDRVELSVSGTEHLRTEKRFVTVFVDNVEKRIPRGVYTTEELLILLEVQSGYLLNLATEDGLKPLKPGERLHLKEGMRFFTQVPAGGSAH